jgi:FkbM family methyltransferase
MPIDCSRISSRSYLGRVVRFPLKIIPGTAVLPILQGPLRGARWVVGSGTHGCWLGSYELPKAELFAGTIQEGMNVFDIGAHAGYYSLIASRAVGKAGRVVAFEPLERNLQHLRRHVALDNASNVSILNAAVTNQLGVARFDPGKGSFLGKLAREGPLEVRTVALDDLVAAGSVSSPDVMKLDIEGEESNALLGATSLLRDTRPTIFLATHGTDVHDACLSILRREGYVWRCISDGHREMPDEIIAQPRT